MTVTTMFCCNTKFTIIVYGKFESYSVSFTLETKHLFGIIFVNLLFIFLFFNSKTLLLPTIKIQGYTKMKELLYFSFSDLLVRVEYSKEANSLKYSSHREINFGERVIVEQYLLSNFALKTDYYNRHPALFIFLGIDKKLVKDLNLFHLKNTLKSLVSHEKEVKEQVSGLISQSMSNYYFEQIGDALLALRKEVNGERRDEIIEASHQNMCELIKAYNLYSDKKITIQEIIPNELRSYVNL